MISKEYFKTGNILNINKNNCYYDIIAIIGLETEDPLMFVNVIQNYEDLIKLYLREEWDYIEYNDKLLFSIYK